MDCINVGKLSLLTVPVNVTSPFSCVAVTPGKSFVASFNCASLMIAGAVVVAADVSYTDTVSARLVFVSLSFCFPLQDDTARLAEKNNIVVMFLTVCSAIIEI